MSDVERRTAAWVSPLVPLVAGPYRWPLHHGVLAGEEPSTTRKERVARRQIAASDHGTVMSIHVAERGICSYEYLRSGCR